MAVETTATSASFTGTGVSSTYAPGFYVNSSDQVAVTVDGVLQTLGDDYVVNNVGASTGCDIVGTFTLGAAIYVERVTPITQLVDTQNNETILEDVLDAEFDKLTMIAQELGGKVARALLFPKGEAGYTLPSPASRASKFLYFDALGAMILSAGSGIDDGLRAELALRGVGQGADLVGARDSGAPAGSVFTTVQGMIDKLRNPTYGGDIIPYGSDKAYADGSVANELTPRVTVAILPIVSPKVGKTAYVQDAGREGFFRWMAGDYTARVAADPYQGIYVASTQPGFGVGVGCWVRIWDEQNGRPEWFGVVPNSSGAAAQNDLRIAACYALVPHTRFGPFDYWTTTTIKANINHHKIGGCGEKYNDVFGAMTRIVCTSGSVDIIRVGPDAYPGSINAMPQGIVVHDIMFGRSVAPVIASGCRGLFMTWVLNAIVENVKTDGNMIGFEASATVHCFTKNCEAVRAVAGTGGGTDYFVGHYANGGSGLFAGGNASLYVVDCTAGCNYGPLQSATGSIGFKADQGFTDVWYWNPETTNFYIAQAVFGNDNAGTVFSNTNFAIFHPIHDQFKYIGIYVTDVASAGSVEIENPYYGPTNGARACYWVNSAEGAVISRGGQFVMGGAPLTQAILLLSSRGCDVLSYPVILEHGNTYAACGVSDVQDARIEVFGKNPNVSAGPLVQIAGTCVAVVVVPKASGKASAFQYGIQVLGAGDNRCEYQVSGLNSASLVAANRKLDRNGVAVVAIGLTGTNYAFGVFT